MFTTILSLFGRSPFAPLQSHMDKVAGCVYLVPDLFDAMQMKDYSKLSHIAAKISEYEHQADLLKNDIRNHLPKSLFLPVDRGNLLEILAIQDRIADTAEDIAVLTTFKEVVILDRFKSDFQDFLTKNLEAFNGAQLVVKEINELLESSFGGVEAQKVTSMVENVAYKEHEVDLIQRKLLKTLFNSEDEITYSTFDLWQRIFQATAAISNLSENLANRIRMTLELK